MNTLKIFYNQSVIKPMYTSFEREVGEKTVIASSKGDNKEVYLISQEEMTQEQADLFHYVWNRNKNKVGFQDAAIFAIKLSVVVAGIKNAREHLQQLQQKERYEREKRRVAQANRAMRKLQKYFSYLDALDRL